jgi:hypothetical protein
LPGGGVVAAEVVRLLGGVMAPYGVFREAAEVVAEPAPGKAGGELGGEVTGVFAAPVGDEVAPVL